MPVRNSLDFTWPREGLTRIPYPIYGRTDVYDEEQARIFMGATLELPLPRSRAAASPAIIAPPSSAICRSIVARDADGAIHAFENRCAHRGALLCLERARQRRKRFTCVYHDWTYDLTATYRRRVPAAASSGKGGMPRGFQAGRARRRASCASPSFARARVRHASATRRRRSRHISARRSPRASARVMRPQPVKLLGRFTPDAAEQLEALRRERQGHLPREPAAPVLHHLPSSTGCRRRAASSSTRAAATTSAIPRSTSDRADAEYEQQQLRSRQPSIKLERPVAARRRRRVRRRHHAADPLGVSRLRAAADPELPSRCGQIVPRGVDQTELILDLLRLRRRRRAMTQRRAEAGEPGRPGRLYLDGGRRVGGFVQRGIAGRRRARLGRRDGRPRRRVAGEPRDRARCAASGRPIARIWGSERWHRISPPSLRCRTLLARYVARYRRGPAGGMAGLFRRGRAAIVITSANYEEGLPIGVIYADFARHAAGPRLIAARGQHLRGAALPPPRSVRP